ncbi:MAG: hypothetical protein J0L72_11075 [Armatimonadetes bacterium]|nr:hypothetical protein [Armatimonadota bacterium]
MKTFEQQFSRKSVADAAFRFISRSAAKGNLVRRSAQFIRSEFHDQVELTSKLVLEGDYKFRYRGVLLNKFGGGTRGITILNGMDYVVHSLLLELVQARAENAVNSRVSYCKPRYRNSGNKVVANHAACVTGISAAHRECKFGFGTDIKNCFGSIDRTILSEKLEGLELCPNTKFLLDRALFTPVDRKPMSATAEEIEKYWSDKSGIVQGSPLSPLIANVYLSDVDRVAESFNAFRYVDDVVVLTKTEAEARDAESSIFGVLSDLKLPFHKSGDSKYEQIEPANGFTFVGYFFRNGCSRIPTPKVDKFKAHLSSLGEISATERGAHSETLFLKKLLKIDRYIRGWTYFYSHANVSSRTKKELDHAIAEEVNRQLALVDPTIRMRNKRQNMVATVHTELIRSRKDKQIEDVDQGVMRPSDYVDSLSGLDSEAPE